MIGNHLIMLRDTNTRLEEQKEGNRKSKEMTIIEEK